MGSEKNCKVPLLLLLLLFDLTTEVGMITHVGRDVFLGVSHAIAYASRSLSAIAEFLVFPSDGCNHRQHSLRLTTEEWPG